MQRSKTTTRRTVPRTVAAAPAPAPAEPIATPPGPETIELTPEQAALCFKAIDSRHYAESAHGIAQYRQNCDVVFVRKEGGIEHSRLVRLPAALAVEVIEDHWKIDPAREI